jgi:sterol desaturase/sphingolipid hydroxylase (fatty acid hydroxylase superfamily)
MAAPLKDHPVLTDELLAAALGPDPKPDLHARAPRFFRAARWERLTRAHPASPYLLWLPVAALCAWRAASLPLPALLGLLAAGALTWTFVEYWLHRAFFHMRADTPARRVTAFIVHRHHHAAPGDPDRIAATPLYSAGLFLLLLAAFGPLGPAGLALLAGSMLGYLAYEAAHWQFHHGRPRGWLRALRAHHLRHHGGDGRSNFGISSPLWDLVFRTWRKGHVREDMN